MNISCATCREPYDSYHLRHDVIWDAAADIGDEACRSFDGKLTPKIRRALASDGWQFGDTVYTVIRCPGCEDRPTDKAAAELRLIAEELLDGDEDALISILGDCDSF